MIFRSALKPFFRHPVYLLICVAWLSSMGLFMGLAASDAATDRFEERPTVAVIDRDGSELSAGLAAFGARMAGVGPEPVAAALPAVAFALAHMRQAGRPAPWTAGAPRRGIILSR